jgi:hypothetical protein
MGVASRKRIVVSENDAGIGMLPLCGFVQQANMRLRREGRPWPAANALVSLRRALIARGRVKVH